MQESQRVTVDALTGVLVDFLTHLKRMDEARSMQLAAGLDMSFSQLCTLFILDISDRPLAVHELAERLGLSVAATGRAVEVLVREGMVQRREDEHDRRVKRVSLDEKGNEIVERLTAVENEALRAFAALLTDEERADLYRALRPILARPDLRAKKVFRTGK